MRRPHFVGERLQRFRQPIWVFQGHTVPKRRSGKRGIEVLARQGVWLRWGLASGISRRDHLPQKQRVGCVQSRYLHACGDLGVGTVVKTVAKASSRFNKVQHTGLQAAESKGQSSGVFTGDPLRPRRLPAFFENALFSSTYVSMRYGRPVEACCILSRPEEPGSYKIIYSRVAPHHVPDGVPHRCPPLGQHHPVSATMPAA